MQVEALKMDRDHAREAYRKYQAQRDHMTAADREIASIYRRIAHGHQVIRAFESIRAAGFDIQGRPRLAIMRADQPKCVWKADADAGEFRNGRGWQYSSARDRCLRVEWAGLKRSDQQFEAVVPLIPVHLRPKRGLAQYHVLWEAEWSRGYPIDPYLLRRFGGDAWLVVAAWDLTDVERAVMATRLQS